MRQLLGEGAVVLARLVLNGPHKSRGEADRFAFHAVHESTGVLHLQELFWGFCDFFSALVEAHSVERGDLFADDRGEIGSPISGILLDLLNQGNGKADRFCGLVNASLVCHANIIHPF